MHGLDMKLSEQLKLTSKIEPLVDHHDSEMRNLNFLVTQSFSAQLLKLQETCEHLSQTKLDTAVNLVDSGKMQSQLNKLEDLAAHYKN
jgi:DNA-binding MurR/RpiR family transcriptional regulator